MSRRLASALIDACRRFGSAPALSDEHGASTYQALLERSWAVADTLRAAGVMGGEPVHVQVSNTTLDLAALLGTWGAGAVAVPVHRSTPAAVGARLRERTKSRWQLDLMSGGSCPLGPGESIESAHPPEPAGAGLARLADALPPARPLLDDAALVIFTSGSTGTPKGVVVAHDAFAGKIEQIDRLLAFGAGERTLLVLNLTFSFGLWVSLLTLLRGGTLVMRPKFDAAAFAATLAAERIDRAAVVPTMMRALLAAPDGLDSLSAVQRAGHLRHLLMGGESLGRSLADTIRARLADTRLVDIYGLTESATCDFFAFPEDYARFPGCIGRASPNIAFRITDSDGAPVVPGEVGELRIHSPYLMRGYLDEPASTAATLADGWLRTGDLARTVDAEGSVVELMGRSKEIIVRAGNKVTPAEIEQALSAHPDVAAAMAVGLPDPVMGERIHALVVPRAGATLDVQQLPAFLAGRMERFKRPDAYYLAADLPLGRTGKADRGQFKVLVSTGALTPLPMPVPSPVQAAPAERPVPLEPSLAPSAPLPPAP